MLHFAFLELKSDVTWEWCSHLVTVFYSCHSTQWTHIVASFHAVAKIQYIQIQTLKVIETNYIKRKTSRYHHVFYANMVMQQIHNGQILNSSPGTVSDTRYSLFSLSCDTLYLGPTFKSETKHLYSLFLMLSFGSILKCWKNKTTLV